MTVMPEMGDDRRLPGWLLDRSPTRRTSPEGLGRPGHASEMRDRVDVAQDLVALTSAVLKRVARK
jgi:hypothetical protein